MERYPGYFPYEVSNWGNVRKNGGNILATFKNKGGYVCVRLYNQELKRKNLRVHRLVAQVWLFEDKSGIESNYVIHHRDGNKDNNKLDNLSLILTAENNRKVNQLNGELLVCSYNWNCPLPPGACKCGVPHKKEEGSNCNAWHRCLEEVGTKKHVMVRCRRV